MEYDNIIESILFASGDPFPVKRLGSLLDISEQEVLEAAGRISDSYKFDNRGIRLIQLEDTLQLCSAPENGDWVRKALDTRKPQKLSAAAMEVLAIAAYYQPVTRVMIEQIRGVDSSYTVGLLVDKGLIEACGRLDVPGRPVLYKTTAAFLRSFGLSSLEELPPHNGAAPEHDLGELQMALEGFEAEVQP